MTARRVYHCCEPIVEPIVEPDGGTYRRCNAPGTEVRIRCPAGRPDAVGGPYCDEHGGERRARDEARRDWNFAAPPSIGGADEVQDAGCLALLTVHAYVDLRESGPEHGSRWHAWLGLGSVQVPVPNPDPLPSARLRRDRKRTGVYYAFATREDAERAARRAWRTELDRRIVEIRAARGGTLDWGVPVVPIAEPIVIVRPWGETRTAWDIAVTLPRRSQDGIAVFSGSRPSGECA